MLNCACCGTSVLLATKHGNERYCNEDCAAAGPILKVSKTIPAHEVAAEAERIHRSNCPTCGQAAPIDLHHAYSIFSFIFVTQWRTKSILSCKKCATKPQLLALVSSALGGWWGVPWGILGTPVTLTRNVIGLVGKTGKNGPSTDLRNFARTALAQDKLASERDARLADAAAAMDQARRLSA